MYYFYYFFKSRLYLMTAHADVAIIAHTSFEFFGLHINTKITILYYT